MAEFGVVDLTTDPPGLIELTGDGGPGAGAHLLEAVRLAGRTGPRTRVTVDGMATAWISPPRSGPDVLYATGKAGSLPEMRAAAMAKARQLYGDDAELRVEGAGPVRGYGSEFICEFTIRCLNFPAEAL